jgi:hypothetical protein
VVQRHHRIVGEPRQQFVQGEDLRPVGGLGRGGLVMNRGDRRLQLVRSGRAAAPELR